MQPLRHCGRRNRSTRRPRERHARSSNTKWRAAGAEPRSTLGAVGRGCWCGLGADWGQEMMTDTQQRPPAPCCFQPLWTGRLRHCLAQLPAVVSRRERCEPRRMQQTPGAVGRSCWCGLRADWGGVMTDTQQGPAAPCCFQPLWTGRLRRCLAQLPAVVSRRGRCEPRRMQQTRPRPWPR